MSDKENVVEEDNTAVAEEPPPVVDEVQEVEPPSDSISQILNGVPKQPEMDPLSYDIPDDTEEVNTTAMSFSFVSPAMFTDKMKGVHTLTHRLDQRVTFLEQQQKANTAAMLAMDAKLTDILGPLFDKLSDRVDAMIAGAESKIDSIVAKVKAENDELLGEGGENKDIEENEGEENASKKRPKNVKDQLNDIYDKLGSLEDRPGSSSASNNMNEEEIKQLVEKVEAIEVLTSEKSDKTQVNDLLSRFETMEGAQVMKSDVAVVEALTTRVAAMEAEHSQTSVKTANGKEELDKFRADMEKRLAQMLEDAARLTNEARAGVAAALEAAATAATNAQDMHSANELKTEQGITSLKQHILQVEKAMEKHQAELKFLHDEVDHLNADHHHHDNEEHVRIDRVTKRQEVSVERKKTHLNEHIPETGNFARPGFFEVVPYVAEKMNEKDDLVHNTMNMPTTNAAAGGGVSSAAVQRQEEEGGYFSGKHIHHVAVADPLEVEEHRRLLRALVRKVNAQGRCLQSLVSEMKILDDRKTKAKKMQKDGIAVQCLSCLRPAESLPRLAEGLPGGERHSSQQRENNEFFSEFAESGARKVLNKSNASTNQRSSSRPKSAGRMRSSSPNNATNKHTPFPLNLSQASQVHTKDQPLMRGMTGGSGGGVFKVVDGQPMTAAVSQYFPDRTKRPTTERLDGYNDVDDSFGGRLSSAQLLGEDLYLEEDMAQFENRARHGKPQQKQKKAPQRLSDPVNEATRQHQNSQPTSATIHISRGGGDNFNGGESREELADLSPRWKGNSVENIRPSSAPVSRRQTAAHEVNSNEEKEEGTGMVGGSVEPMIEKKWKTEEEVERDDNNEGWDKLI